ncbi:heparinase II/III domain-containing protein [Paenibacillus cymbidii]|uniref:heparinase II/III domain-containing protein n=1 Tax=Paenibacillus cymbidii TaxID=1639034 RepID=UPI0010803391|nr:heparinase II/III family protein [Paenibacillus cymbidii]
MKPMQTRALVPDWQAVRDKVETHSWAKRIVEQVKPNTDKWIAVYEDDATRVAGWGHHYFCDRCFASLVFDPEKPHEHRCSGCGEQRVAQEVDDAWCYIYRTSSCSHVFHAAVLYRLYGDPAYLAYIRKVMAFLCDHYGTFEVRTPPTQEGMFSGCDLTDAVADIWLLNGLELIKDELTAEELGTYAAKFFLPQADFLIEKVGCTPNIIIWMKAAAGMIGLFTGERVWCERAAEGVNGIKSKLAAGLLPEGFWYEASFHYHFYCAEGMTYYLAFCKIYGHSFPEMEEALLKMYRYPVRFAFPNGEFPNPSDGWPLLSFANYAGQYEWMRNLYDLAPFRYALSKCYATSAAGAAANASKADAGNVGGLPRLLFGTDWEAAARELPADAPGLPDGKPRFDPGIHFAKLQSGDAALFLKYGFVLRGHSHADAMHTELFLRDEIVSRDISNSGYGSDLFREWQRKAIAHNTVMVDRQNQPNRPAGRMVAFDAEANSCHAAADDVYPGLGFSRKLQLAADGLTDEFAVTPAEGHEGTHTFDWLFHCSGELETELPMEAADAPGEADGYQLMLDTSSCETDGDWEVSWKLPGKTVTLRMEACPGTTVYVFRGYEHRLDRTRWGVMARRTGESAVYRAAFRWTVEGGAR